MDEMQQMLSTIDDRVKVEGRPIRESKKHIMVVSCAACGGALAYSNYEDRGVALAVHNATARPCCEAWGEPHPELGWLRVGGWTDA